MNEVNKTLYIPLYGKALVSKKGILLKDPKSEEIWEKEGFPLKGKAASKWLAYYMGMRSAVFDRWLQKQLEAMPDAVVLHLGCGMDSRVLRVGAGNRPWYDVDFPEVIAQRKNHYREEANYRMIPSDIRQEGWLEAIPKGKAILVMEGVSMYLTEGELLSLLEKLKAHFTEAVLLMDCYTVFAAKASRYKNPVNEVGVTTLYGMDDPKIPERAGFRFLQERELTPDEMIKELKGFEQRFFRRVLAGPFAKKLYRLYEYAG